MSSVQSFAELFSPAPAPVAPTEAPPSARLPVLRDALDSGIPRRQLIALQACDVALETGHFLRMVGAERQGLSAVPHLWSPQDPGEILDAYRQIWDLVRSRIGLLEGNVQAEAVRILLKRARGIGNCHGLTELVVETLRDLAGSPFVDQRQVLKIVEEVLHYDSRHLPTEIIAQWQALRGELTGHEFPSLLRRYVGMDLIEDKFDEQGNHTDKTTPLIEQLAGQAVERPDLLKPELEWLLSGDAPNGLRFGYEIGKRDAQEKLLPTLLDALRALAPRAHGYLLSGYLRAMAETGEDRWEGMLDRLAADAQLRYLVPELTWRSKLTNRAARRILALARDEAISSEQFGLFGMGGVIRSISEEVLLEWLEFLLDAGDQARVVDALHLLYFYYVHDRQDAVLPMELTRRLLTHESLFRDVEGGRLDSMAGHAWQDTAMRLLDLYPQHGLALSEILLQHLRDKGGIYDGSSSPVFSVLNRVLAHDPEGLWALVAPLLGPPVDARAYRLGAWLHGSNASARGRPAALSGMPKEAVWAWVEADLESRAWYIASLAPRDLCSDSHDASWQREVLVRYGDREDVRRNIGVNFGIEAWWGSEAEHWTKRKTELIAYRATEDNPRVLRWIDDQVAALDARIDRARTEEEREW